MILSYYIILFTLLVFFSLMLLSNLNIIFKGNNKIGNFFKHTLLKLIIKRIFYCILTLFVSATIIFILMRIMPKDFLYESMTSFDFSVKSPIYSSDSSVFEQLLDYYYNILPFPKKICSNYHLTDGNLSCNEYSYKIINLGESYFYMKNVDVWTIIKDKCFISLLIGCLAYFLQCLIGFPLGIYIAKKKNKYVNETVNFFFNSINNIPAILYFYLFALFFMSIVGLPIYFELDSPLTYIAPLTALFFWSFLCVAYWINKYVSLEMDKDYIKLAISKGFSTNYIFYKHIIKNALIPFFRTIPATIASSIMGFYLLEMVFNIPGAGLTIVNAIRLQDIYLVQGLILFFTFISILAYLIGDLITIMLDKKVYLEKEELKNE